MCCTRLAGNTGRKNDAKNRHLCTIPQLCRAISLQLRHVSTIGKKLVKQQYIPHKSSQYGELRPTSGWDLLASLGTPANCNAFRLLAALLHGILVLGVSQTLRRPTEGATYIRHGGYHVGHWPTFLVHILAAPYAIGQAVIFLPCGFFLSFFLSSFLLLFFLAKSQRSEIGCLLPHMVWP